MGVGCINMRGIRPRVEATGLAGWIEVEIFSDRYWATDQDKYLTQIKNAYLQHV